MGNINRGRARREELREKAEERASERAARTPAGQLRVLDTRLGDGVGAVRERERLVSEIERGKTAKKKSDSKSTSDEKRVGRGDRRKAKARRNAEREKSGKQ